MTLHAEVVPQLLTSGVAPNGKRYDLIGLGTWLEELTDDQRLAFYQSGTMTKQMIRDFWTWSGRKDRMPKSLKVYLQINPEFRDWVSLAKAYQFASSRITSVEADKLKAAMQRAFAAGQIRIRGIEVRDERGQFIGYDNIQLDTADLVKWLDYEFEIKTTRLDIACYPQSAETLHIMFPKGTRT